MNKLQNPSTLIPINPMFRPILDDLLSFVPLSVTFDVGFELLDGDAEGADEIVGPDEGDGDGILDGAALTLGVELGVALGDELGDMLILGDMLGTTLGASLGLALTLGTIDGTSVGRGGSISTLV